GGSSLDSPNPSDRSPEVKPSPPAGDADLNQEPATFKAWLAQNGSMLVLLIALFVGIVLRWGWVPVIVGLGLGFLIFVHELGHFLVAKWCDVHVETFSVGFGPAIPGCSFQRGETYYKLAWIPLGGYVKMVGEGPEEDEHEDDPRSFKNKP